MNTLLLSPPPPLQSHYLHFYILYSKPFNLNGGGVNYLLLIRIECFIIIVIHIDTFNIIFIFLLIIITPGPSRPIIS